MVGTVGTPSSPDTNAKKPDIRLPKGYEDEAAFLMEMRAFFATDSAADQLNRDAAAEDISFTAGEQWLESVRAKRAAAQKPILTVNRLPAFVGQVVGSRRQSETTIKIIPDNGGTKQVADVREGLLRSIQKLSHAEEAYNNALLGAVVCGIGNFQLSLEYESEDVFEQRFAISSIADHLSVVWDRGMVSATGEDATRCFVVDTLSEIEFGARYPWATPSNIATMGPVAMDYSQNWFEGDDVRVVSYWRIRTRKRTLALVTSGATLDITDMDLGQIQDQIVTRADGSPIMREVNRRYAQKYVCSGLDILEGPYELPCDRIPVFRVPGWELRLGNTSTRWGLVRFLKDPQRLHNYWRSVMAEKLTQTPKNIWVASDISVQGHEKEWRSSHLSDDPLLIYNGESGQAPQRQVPAQVEPALMQQAEITSQDIKDVSNIHEANLGMPSNEVSGVAITARQRVSDTGTIIYHTNLAAAIEECGRVANQLIPMVYDTPRIIKVLGADAKTDMVAINQIGNPEAVDITTGAYSVTVTTGPAFDTKRVETADNMLRLAQAMPNIIGVSADLIVEAQDWPGAAHIADRLRAAMPISLLTPDEQTPLVQQNAQAQQQAQQTQQQTQDRLAAAEFQAQQAKAELDAARAQHYVSQTKLAPVKVALTATQVASSVQSKEAASHIAAIKV